MKTIKFYLEYPSIKDKINATRKSLGKHSGNCIAVIDNTKQLVNMHGETYCILDAICSVFYKDNSDVCYSTVNENYIWERCKRISEKSAKEIHPRLFEYLNQ